VDDSEAPDGEESDDENEGKKRRRKHGGQSPELERCYPSRAQLTSSSLVVADGLWAFTQTQAEPCLLDADASPLEDAKYKMLVSARSFGFQVHRLP